jgi:hypothetical protein
MLSWVPPSAHAPHEDEVAALARYRRIATDIVAVAFDPREAPLFDGPDGRVKTAVVLAAIASMESGLARRIDDGSVRGDHGVAWGLFQVHCFGKVAEGWSCRDLVDDREKGVRVALRMARQSFAACRGLELLDRLSVYTTGQCYSGQHESRARLERAMGWMKLHQRPRGVDARARARAPSRTAG